MLSTIDLIRLLPGVRELTIPESIETAPIHTLSHTHSMEADRDTTLAIIFHRVLLRESHLKLGTDQRNLRNSRLRMT